VYQKIVEHHKIESGCKKIDKALKTHFHNQGNNYKVLMNLPGRGRVSEES